MKKKLKDVCDFYSGTGFPTQYQGELIIRFIRSEIYQIMPPLVKYIWNYAITIFLKIQQKP